MANSTQLALLQGRYHEYLNFTKPIPGSILRMEQDAVPTYQKAHAIYQNLLKDLVNLQEEINRVYSGDDPVFLASTQLFAELETFHRKLTDQLVTRFPQADIDYGPPMAGNRQAWGEEDVGQNPRMRQISREFPCMRKIRGDGNCFFTGFAVGLLESFAHEKDAISFMTRILNSGIGSDSYKMFLSGLFCKVLGNPFVTLGPALQNNKNMLPIVHDLRQTAGAYMREHRGEFEPFITGISFDDYITTRVLQMGEEAEAPEISALGKALDFPFRIVDPLVNASQPTSTDIPGVFQFTEPRMTLCRKTGHYFVLYREIPPLQAPASISQARVLLDTELVVTTAKPIQFGNNLFIRGSGGNLNWDKGIPLVQKNDTWVWRAQISAGAQIEYKILLNDEEWEEGGNHKLQPGKNERCTPRFLESTYTNQKTF